MDQLEQTNPHSSPWEPVDKGTGEIDAPTSPFESVIWPATAGGIDITALAGFVDHLLHDSERADPGKYWCEEWWRHPEAILIFHALQMSMSRAEKDLNTWIMHDLAPQLNYLFGDEGPFRSCKPGQHKYKNTPYEGDPNDWVPYRRTSRTVGRAVNRASSTPGCS